MDSTIANPNPEKVIARTSECMRRLIEAGLTYDDLQRPIDDPDMRNRLVRFWQSGGYEPTTTQKLARAIGIPVFGIEEAVQHFGVKPTRTQLSALAEIPFTEAELRECKDTHILVAVFPMSILEIRGKVSGSQRLFYDQGWYNKQVFAKEKGKTEWRLVRKTPIDSSISKTWPEQQALLSDKEETPSAQVMVYTIIGHFLATGERLFEHIYVRTSSVASVGCRVHVGLFVAHGLFVYFYDVGDRSDSVGLSSSQKVQSQG